jgi:hypothetical protein
VNPAKPLGQPSVAAPVGTGVGRSRGARVEAAGCGRGAEVLPSPVLTSRTALKPITAIASTTTVGENRRPPRRSAVPVACSRDAGVRFGVAAADLPGRGTADVEAPPPSQPNTAQPLFSCQQSPCWDAPQVPHTTTSTPRFNGKRQ